MINNYILELDQVLVLLDSYSGPDLHVLQWNQHVREQLVLLAKQNQHHTLFKADLL